MSGEDRDRALAAWTGRGERKCLLPSGTWALVVVPAPEQLVRDPRVPERLRMRALQFATVNIEVAGLDEDGLREMLDLQAHLSARALRALWDDQAPEDENGDRFVRITLTPEEIAELQLPSEDLTALEQIALRRVTPNQVTVASQRDLGLVSPAEAKRVIDEEAAGTVPAYEAFRGEQGGPDPRPNGADLRPAPELDAGDTGPSAGVGG